MFLLPRNMSDPGHPKLIQWDDSFSFQNYKIKILIKSHIAVY
nr:translational initiation factor 1 [Garcinia esculenta]QUJ10262.1 translation initiation factor 1 [Garcinia anomala]WPW46254.1 translational initiation factor 1 [Garcinia esculenta]WQG15120.1 translational initiation factor 1 [Garcinia esculenta]WQH62405.1 translational initiation factor 1 [Garcinia esculenta]WQM20572.1 translational initiation factor 1 [Garcinia esculenta]